MFRLTLESRDCEETSSTRGRAEALDTKRPSVTQFLQRWSTGDREAAEQALPLVYNELRRIAARELRRERGAQTLQATAIVHEAYMRLAGQTGLEWPSRAHFLAFAAYLIRQVLVDHARNRDRLKRGKGYEKVTLREAADLAWEKSPDVIALDEALSSLEKVDPRKASIVELKFFAGLTLEEIAEQLGISAVTVSREWRRARTWLYSALQTNVENGA